MVSVAVLFGLTKNFFQTWITQGATKFFIYLQSLSPEADELLRVYEADPDIDVERVHWAPLPNDDPENEPNNYVYRGEVIRFSRILFVIT